MILFNTFLQACCISLIGIAAGFIVIELKTKFDRSHLYFGICIILLCLFSAIDLWKQPFGDNLFWTKIQHMVACFIPVTILKYLMILTKKSNHTLFRNIVSIATITSILFAVDTMFRMGTNNFEITLVYFFLFLPFLFSTSLYCIYYITSRFRSAIEGERKLFLFHIVGLVLLLLCGTIDMISLMTHSIILSMTNFTIIGTIGLGILLTYVFTDRFISLLNAHKTHVSRLTMAYQELESARSLSELGKSTSIINHEINNYIFSIQCAAELIKHEIGRMNLEKAITVADRLLMTLSNLQEFGKDILEFSKSKIIDGMRPINIGQRINRTINDHFQNKADAFSLAGFAEEHIIHGDWLKLDHVFYNLIKNSFDAQAQMLRIKIIEGKNVLLITFEDDGCGFSGNDPQVLFNSFYTTKGKRGTGLGLSITRSIVEAHGGHINIGCKELLSNGNQSIKFSITFPLYTHPCDKQPEKPEKGNFLLIKKNVEPLQSMFTVFRNISLNPYVISDITEFDAGHFTPETIIILGSPSEIALFNSLYCGYRCFSVVPNGINDLYIVGNRDDLYTGLFCEEFLLSSIK